MWYHRAAVEFMLHHGIANFDDITWSLDATGRLPPSTLEAPLALSPGQRMAEPSTAALP